MPLNPAIQALDLRILIERLTQPDKGPGWTQAHAELICKEYRRFLFLKLHSPERGSIRPPPDIDVFWHEHILDTRKYDADCRSVFGTFLHHDPAQPPQVSYGLHDRTMSRYRLYFGEPDDRIWGRPVGCG